jgi:hypothetical protein
MAPRKYTAVSNSSSGRGSPMTTFQFDIRRYRTPDGPWMHDALDPGLFTEPVNPDDPASPTFGGITEGSLGPQAELLGQCAWRHGGEGPSSPHLEARRRARAVAPVASRPAVPAVTKAARGVVRSSSSPPSR